MKKQVRKNIFETNSSSTHSIVIGNNGEDVHDGLPHVLEFHGDEFGWEHRLHTDTQSKANYLFTSLVYTNDPFTYIEKIREILSKWDVEAEFDEIEKKECSNGESYYVFKNGYCYVDHGDGNNELVKALCENEDLLMNYLFSNGSYVETSNDNDDYPILGKEPKNVMLDYYKGN